MKQKYSEAFIEQAVVKLLSRGKRTVRLPRESEQHLIEHQESTGDARNIQQIIDQTRHLPDLAGKNRGGFFDQGFVTTFPRQQFRRST